ncbi:MAG: AlpA family phage regulatory protein [Gloeomargaritaceae cyanobacterium C42_A2020_066]|nr:AlpA family phage regulatory protein [Gloeomargaritaceae cyanobacterium C42_A2020_066]
MLGNTKELANDLAKRRYLDLPEVLEIFRLSRTTWYQGIKLGRYPKPIKVGQRRVVWRAADLEALAQRLEGGADAES